MKNLQTKTATDFVCGDYLPVTTIFMLDVDGWTELASVWEADGLTYWDSPEDGTVHTGTVNQFTEWLVTKTA